MLQLKLNLSRILFLLVISLTFFSCKKKEVLSDLAGLTSFSIEGIPASFTIDEAALKISNADSLPFGSDVTALVANFSAVPKSTVKIGSVEQVSGVTVNNFSSPLTYTVVAEDGVTARAYSVVVNVSKVDPKTIAWQQLTPNGGWDDSHTLMVTVMNDKFYLIGGTMGAFGAFSFTTNVSNDGITWTRTRAVDNNGDSVPRVEHPAFISFNNKLWILGGHRPGEGFSFDDVTNKVLSSTDGVNWTASVPADPADRWEKRERIGAVVFKNKLWVIGGNAYPSFGNTNAPAAAFNDVWSSSDGENWDQVTANAPFLARTNPAVFVHANKIWIAGGRDNGGNYLNDIWTSEDGSNWTEVSVSKPFSERIAPQVVVNEGSLILVGGENEDGSLGDMWVSEDDAKTWTKVEGNNVMALPSNFKPRKDFSMFVHSGSIYIIGGLGQKDAVTLQYEMLNDVWKGSLQ